MPRVQTLQTNFTSGVLDPRLKARADIKQYYQGLDQGENVILLPQGGLARRPGLLYQDALDGDGRLASFEFNTEQTYIFAFTDLQVEVFRDGVSQATVVTPWSEAELPELYWTQSADTMILVHPEHAPRTITRGATHTIWTLATPTLTNIPTFDFGSGAEPVISATRGWPRTVTFHQARLVFGGTRDKPQSVLMSKTNDFFNLDLGTGLDDEGIFETIDTDQVNAINGVYAGRHLQIFTSGGEFYIPDRPITPSAVSFIRPTEFGASAVKPISIDGSTLFIDTSGRAVREFLFTVFEDAYTSDPASLLAPHLLNSPTYMAKQLGTGVDSVNFVYVVNSDGTIALLSTLRSQDIRGWAKWTTAGNFKSVAVIGDDAYFLVERVINSVTVYLLEKASLSAYLDSAIQVTNSPATDVITGLDHLNGELCRVRADETVFADVTPSGGSATIESPAEEVEVGLDWNPTIKTMPLNVEFGDGPILSRKKRIVRCYLRLYESSGATVNGTVVSFRELGDALLDAPIPKFTGTKMVGLRGWSEEAQVTISQDDPVPLTILGLTLEVTA